MCPLLLFSSSCVIFPFQSFTICFLNCRFPSSLHLNFIPLIVSPYIWTLFSLKSFSVCSVVFFLPCAAACVPSVSLDCTLFFCFFVLYFPYWLLLAPLVSPWYVSGFCSSGLVIDLNLTFLCLSTLVATLCFLSFSLVVLFKFWIPWFLYSFQLCLLKLALCPPISCLLCVCVCVCVCVCLIYTFFYI